MFKYINNIADIELLITAPDEKSLVLEAVSAFYEVIVEKENITSERKIQLEINGQTLEDLLYSLFNELIYLFDTGGFLCRSAVIDEKKPGSIIISLEGEDFDKKRHNIKNIIKAVTLHNFNISCSNSRFYLRTVFDI